MADTTAPEGIYRLLTAATVNPELAAKVGSKVYPTQRPKASGLPAVITGFSEVYVGSKDDDEIDFYDFRVRILSQNYTELQDLTRYVRDAINRKETTLNGVGRVTYRYQGLDDEDFEPERGTYETRLVFRGIPLPPAT